jgi:hypothetical protein
LNVIVNKLEKSLLIIVWLFVAATGANIYSVVTDGDALDGVLSIALSVGLVLYTYAWYRGLKTRTAWGWYGLTGAYVFAVGAMIASLIRVWFIDQGGAFYVVWGTASLGLVICILMWSFKRFWWPRRGDFSLPFKGDK